MRHLGHKFYDHVIAKKLIRCLNKDKGQNNFPYKSDNN